MSPFCYDATAVPPRSRPTGVPGCLLLLIFLLLIGSTGLTAAQAQVSADVITTSVQRPESVHTADLDGDDHPDVLSASYDDNKIAWYENTLDTDGSSFSDQKVLNANAKGAQSVTTADLDQDGDPDVVSVTWGGDGNNDVAWYENKLDTEGTFSGENTITTSAKNGLESVYAVDLNGDDYPDLLTISGFRVAWYENKLDENGSFGSPQTINDSFFFGYSVYAADLDGDGDKDVVYGSDDDAGWHENKLDTEGTFGSENTLHSRNSGGIRRTRRVYAADLDGDSENEILTSTSNGLIRYDNLLDRNGSFGNREYLSRETAEGGLHVADFNGDDHLDVFASNISVADDFESAVTSVNWYENNLDSRGTFARLTVSENLEAPSSIDVADLEGDGSPEILTADSGGNSIVWYQNRPPSISGMRLSSASNNVHIRFESNQRLQSTASDLAVSVDGPDGTEDLYTFDRTDFTVSGSAPYTYTLSTEVAYTKGPGTYTATIDRAIGVLDEDGADGTQTASHTFSPVVSLALDSTREVVELPPDGSSTADVTFSIENTEYAADTTGVAVDVPLPSSVTVQSSAATDGNYSSGTWTGIDLPGGTTETLTLSLAMTDGVQTTLTPTLSGTGDVSTSTRIAPRPNGSGNALTFDGTDDLVKVPDDVTINTGKNAKKRTIELWFKTANATSSNEQILYESGTNPGMSIAITENGRVAVSWENLERVSGYHTTYELIESGTWHHVAVVFNEPKGYLRIFLDGRQYEHPLDVNLITDDGAVGIGAFRNGGSFFDENVSGNGRYFEGQIDQVRLWNGALSQRQVQSRAHRTINLRSAMADSLLLAYRFEAGSGQTIHDLAGYQGTFLNGSVDGAPQWTTVSGSPRSRERTSLAAGESATLGPSGGTVSVNSVSAANDEALQVYQYGRTDGPLVPSSEASEDFSQLSEVSKRLHPVWGLEPTGTPSAGVTLNYSQVQGLVTPSNVRLLKRNGPGAPWQNVSADWTWNRTAQTFSKTGVSSFSQYAIGVASSPLPVELARFEGTTTEDGVRLTWATASETNNARFEVQRRTVDAAAEGGTPDGAEPNRPSASTADASWTTVGQVDGSGTTERAQTYRFTDEAPSFAADTLRYRLKQVDTDGSTSYSDPLTVSRSGVEALRLLGTYPNPARTRATVRFTIPEGTDAQTVKMRLYDVLGRRVQTIRHSAEPGRHTLQLPVQNLAGGVYVLRLRAGNTTRSQKLTIVR